MPNMYEYFVHKGLALLRPNGLFSFIVPDRLAFNGQFVQLRRVIATGYQMLELVFKVPFPGITADTLIFVLRSAPPKPLHSVTVSEFGRTAVLRKQADFLGDPSCVFDYFDNQAVMDLSNRLYSMPQAIMLGDLFDSTSGFGGKSELIGERKTKSTEIQTLKGDSIQRYQLRKIYWFEFVRRNITGRTTDPDKLGASPKVLLRKTSDRIIATYDSSGIYPEQSLYFLFNQKSSLGFQAVLSILNSKLLTFLFRAKAVTNKKSIAQLKKVDLDRLPICPISPSQQAELSRLANQMLAMQAKLADAPAESNRTALNRMIAATEIKIDKLVFDLYGLNEEEIRMVEDSVNIVQVG